MDDERKVKAKRERDGEGHFLGGKGWIGWFYECAVAFDLGGGNLHACTL